MIRSTTYSFFIVCAGFFLTGCFREVVRDPKSLADSPDDDIVVTTKDGFSYSLSEGDYYIVSDTLGHDVITGKGKRCQPGSSQWTGFEGDIPLSTIDKVTVSESTPWLFVTASSILILVGFVLLLGPHGKDG